MNPNNFNRDDYPTLSAPSPDCGGAVFTSAMLESFRAWVSSDEYRENHRKAQEEVDRQMQAMNDQLKRMYAADLGKTVGQLTKQDMEKLNERFFQAWLKYKGVTEKEFWDWIG